MTRIVVFKEKLLCGDDGSIFLMTVDEQLAPGVYLGFSKTNESGFPKDLLVQ
jgi:hypothetical protein